MIAADAAPAANPAPHSPIAPPNVVDRVSTFVKRFVFLKEPSLYRLLALWVIHTYLVDEFEYTGYVFAHSPEPESGKTRLLEVLEVLVENSSGILVSPSESVLFRTALGHTQFLDEVDTWTNKDQLRSVLNSGFQHGVQVLRMTEKKVTTKITRSRGFPSSPRALCRESGFTSSRRQHEAERSRLKWFVGHDRSGVRNSASERYALRLNNSSMRSKHGPRNTKPTLLGAVFGFASPTLYKIAFTVRSC
jgi:hypothetical protein